MERLVLTNLGLEINVEDFAEEYKEKNIQFFKSLDKAITDSFIKIYRAIADEDTDYYNLIVVQENGVYNAIPEPLFTDYITIEKLYKIVDGEEIERKEMEKLIRTERETSYIYFRQKEDKAKLFLKLISLTNGKLTKEEMEEIINGIDMEKYLYNSIEIIISTEAKEFSKYITLDKYTSNWGDRKQCWSNVFLTEIKKESDNTIIDNGNFNFGYSEDDEIIKIPNFNINKKYSVLINTIDYDNYGDIDKDFNVLYVYIPSETPYKMEKEIQYVLDNFNI